MTLNDTGTAASRGSSWKKWLGIITTATVVVVICVLIRHIGGGPEKAAATPPQKTQSPQAAVSTVSNTRQDSPASPAASIGAGKNSFAAGQSLIESQTARRRRLRKLWPT